MDGMGIEGRLLRQVAAQQIGPRVLRRSHSLQGDGFGTTRVAV